MTDSPTPAQPSNEQTARILVVDDELSVRQTLEMFLRRQGYQVKGAPDGAAALDLLSREPFQMVLSDIRMPQMDGMALLKEIKKIDSTIQVLMITAYNSSVDAVEAMRFGAYDYITKPFDLEEIKELVSKALEKQRLLMENRNLKSALDKRVSMSHIVGKSEAMQKVFAMVQQVAGSRTTVLVSGQSGTGKELVSRAVHNLSERAHKPFVPLNCGAIPHELMESELFGHVRGSFTGAVADKIGLFVEANGGTLFLDEVSELSMDLQVKLLRALQERKVRPVGGVKELDVDVRVIAATNRDLHAFMKEGRFREDLFFRLNVINIVVPPLKDRRDDIPRLTHHFLNRICHELERPEMTLSPAAMDVLMNYNFPGNVRELINILERCVTLSRSGVIEPQLFPGHVLASSRYTEQKALAPQPDPPMQTPERDMLEPSRPRSPTQLPYPLNELPLEVEQGIDLEGLLERIERHYLEEALKASGGVKKDAATLLGLSFRSFRYRLQKQNME